MTETCSICGCTLHRDKGTYARPTVEGRSHATLHHFVAERFFGRSSNRRGTQTDGLFASCPWGHEGNTALFCYECHEELLHNPVLLPEDILRFAEVVRCRGLNESKKEGSRFKLAGRVKLLHEAIAKGLQLLEEEKKDAASEPRVRLWTRRKQRD